MKEKRPLESDCSFSVALPLRKLTHSLPKDVPTPPTLQFTVAGDGWPPRPKGQKEIKFLRVEPISGDLNDSLEKEIRCSALNNHDVKSLVGERFVHLTTDVRSFSKGKRPDPLTPLKTRVLFHNQTENLTVEVLMAGLSVQAVSTLPHFQPPEAPEEIEEAIALARAHPTIAEHVCDLDAGALLLPFRTGDPGYRHRILWVTFFEAGEIEAEKPALFSAAVDITDQRVLVARKELSISETVSKFEGKTNA